VPATLPGRRKGALIERKKVGKEKTLAQCSDLLKLEDSK
jgi:hypothetical protein